MKELNCWCVYIHTTPVNKKYIGITSRNPYIRWAKGRGYSHSPHFNNAILKYGWDNIQHKIVCSNLTEEVAKAVEITLIYYYNTTNPEFGYNITKGGSGSLGRICSEETKRKIALKCIGRKLTPEQNEALHKIKRKRVEQYDKQGNYITTWESVKSAARALNYPSPDIIRCCSHKTKSACNYIWKYEEDSCKIKPFKKESGAKPRKIIQYDLNNNYLREYNSAKEAALLL